MKNLRRHSSTITLIAANLVPLVGVLFFGWEPLFIFIIYLLESIIMGFFNVVKMVTVYVSNREVAVRKVPGQTGVSGWGLIPFFIVHYFFFIFVQCGLFFGFAGIASDKFSDPFRVVHNLMQFINPETGIALGGILLSHAVSYAMDFMLTGEFATTSLAQLMFRPYKRIFVQQFVVLLGGFAFMMLGLFLPKAGLFAFVVLFSAVKIFFDLKFQKLVDQTGYTYKFD